MEAARSAPADGGQCRVVRTLMDDGLGLVAPYDVQALRKEARCDETMAWRQGLSQTDVAVNRCLISAIYPRLDLSKPGSLLQAELTFLPSSVSRVYIRGRANRVEYESRRCELQWRRYK